MLSEGKLVQRLIGVMTWIGGIAMLLMMCHIMVDVVGRIVFNHPFDGTIEIVAGYYMVAVIFLPLAFVTHYEGHIRVELFTKGLSRRATAALEAGVAIICLVVLGWFLWQSIVAAHISFVSGEQLETAADLITIWPSRMLIPVGLGLMAVYMVLRLIDDIRIALSRA